MEETLDMDLIEEDPEVSGHTTKGPVTITVGMFREAADAIKAAMIVARALGYSGAKARSMANMVAKEITGIDVFEIMSIGGNEIEVEKLLKDQETLLPLASDRPSPDGLDDESFTRFIRERCSLYHRHKILAKTFYLAFLKWCQEGDIELAFLPAQRRFARLANRHFRYITTPYGKAYVGVGIKGDAEEIANPITDEVYKFIEERCLKVPTAVTSATDLYKSFLQWRKSEGSQDIISQTSFGRVMGAFFKKSHHSGRKMYCGVALK